LIHDIPNTLRKAQTVFEHTGGIHAAALVDIDGNMIAMREDVGRHNAVDKLIGSQLFEGKVPLSNCLIMVSGRASFELIQKSVMAGIPILAAVGAPSSLAIGLANKFNMTVLGFVRDKRFNIYSGEPRISQD
ncbi:MAG: formate dehydrogenase accessory sulfurtransferase FdhD, partial [Flavobacteriales bacterium]|nr:formate dehydrogenase accessory sulfurtransferase FdhD [Flavobacteriales bacterium]